MHAATTRESKTSLPRALGVAIAVLSLLFIALSMHSLEMSPTHLDTPAAASVIDPANTSASSSSTEQLGDGALADLGTVGLLGCATLGLVCSVGLLVLVAKRRSDGTRPSDVRGQSTPPQTRPLVATKRVHASAMDFVALGVLRT